MTGAKKKTKPAPKAKRKPPRLKNQSTSATDPSQSKQEDQQSTQKRPPRRREPDHTTSKSQTSQQKRQKGRDTLVQKPKYFVVKTELPMASLPGYWEVLGEIDSTYIFDSPPEDGKSCVLGIGENLFITLKSVEDGIARSDEVEVNETPASFESEKLAIKTEVGSDGDQELMRSRINDDQNEDDVGCLTLDMTVSGVQSVAVSPKAGEDSTLVHVIHPADNADTDLVKKGTFTLSETLDKVLEAQDRVATQTDETGTSTIVPDAGDELDELMEDSDDDNGLSDETPAVMAPLERIRNERVDKNPVQCVCRICGDVSINLSDLISHMKRLHADDNPYVCDICGSTTFKHLQGLKRHREIHTTTEKSHKCGECGKRFVFLRHLKAHQETHSDSRPYLCQQCGSAFKRLTHLQAHELVHKKPVRSRQKLSKKTECQCCGKQVNRRNLQVHLRIHTGENPYVCEVCGKTFNQSTSLKSHSSIHTGEKPHTCHICGRSFRLSTMLKGHMRLHTNTGPKKSVAVKNAVPKKTVNTSAVCEICGQSVTRCHLKEHVRTHTGEKPFVCNVCGKAFIRSVALKIHSYLHTGEKPYSCSVCGKSFRLYNSLKGHKRVHTGEKPFDCQICHKSYREKGSLRKHLASHAGYVKHEMKTKQQSNVQIEVNVAEENAETAYAASHLERV